MDETFEAALVEHLSALQARDVERFGATLGEHVTVVDGQGTITDGRDEVLQSHAEWFAMPVGWRFDYTVLVTRELADAGLALIDVAYRHGEDAEPSRFLLSLLFERTSGGWRFVYDQNTPLITAG
ncbi:MAG TPA: nuclear transport factor 2 family protein [Candidatus Elarobacter sp.]|jgi:uncharacterized protein (TIGR02246 family)